METDAFFVAFRLPNLLRRMFAEGAFSQAFVPILAEYKEQARRRETHRLINSVASALGLAVLIVSILGALAAPLIIYATAPAFGDASKFELTVQLTRITFRTSSSCRWWRWPAACSTPGAVSRSRPSRRCCSTSPSSPWRCLAAPVFRSAGAGAGLGGVHRRHNCAASAPVGRDRACCRVFRWIFRPWRAAHPQA